MHGAAFMRVGRSCCSGCCRAADALPAVGETNCTDCFGSLLVAVPSCSTALPCFDVAMSFGFLRTGLFGARGAGASRPRWRSSARALAWLMRRAASS
eukprot:5045607-Pyramimonas_sp.AAC.1